MISLHIQNGSHSDIISRTRPEKTPHSAQRFTMVLLAGSLGHLPLRRALDVPVLCLPIDSRHTLLDLWLKSIASIPGCGELVIAVSTHSDAREVENCLATSSILESLQRSKSSAAVNIVVDVQDYRGAGGVLVATARDRAIDESCPIIVAEASMLPFEGVERLLQLLAEGAAGVVVGTKSHEPAGLYGFNADVIAMLPKVAFLDLKEQVLPYLHEQGRMIELVVTTDSVMRMRTRSQYLKAVAAVNAHFNEARVPRPRNVRIANSVRISGCCLIADDVVIERDAIIHNSIIHSGVRIGARSVVARSVIGADAVVSPDALHKDVVIERAANEVSRLESRWAFGNRFISRDARQFRLHSFLTGIRLLGSAAQ